MLRKDVAGLSALMRLLIVHYFSYIIVTMFLFKVRHSTYDHRVWKTGLPVRSAILKPHAGWLVVGWVTTSESRLLYVFVLLFEEK